jgi:hypothetical protein
MITDFSRAQVSKIQFTRGRCEAVLANTQDSLPAVGQAPPDGFPRAKCILAIAVAIGIMIVMSTERGPA